MTTKHRKKKEYTADTLPGNFDGLGRDIKRILEGKYLAQIPPVAGRVRFVPINGDPGCEGWLTTYPQPVTDEFGGWVSVPRDGQIAVVEYQGTPGATGRVIDVLFDDWANARSINAYWDAFIDICHGHDFRAPTPLRVVWIGQSAPDKARQWVVSAMTPGPEVLIADDARGTLLRRSASVTILDSTQGELILDPVKAARHKAKKKPGKASKPKRRRVVIARQGDTLHSIAVRYLHDQMRWHELDVISGLSYGTRDAAQALPVGTRVQLP